MEGNYYQQVHEGDEEPKAQPDVLEMQHCAERIWNAVSKYMSQHVTIDQDAIFKDPDWPHLWDKK